MAQIELKAHQLRNQAEKKMSSGGFFKTLFSNGACQIEESIEYYTRAGNLFKMAKNWTQAGHAFSDAAELSLRGDNYTDAAFNFVESANCFKKCDVAKAVELYLKAIEIYKDKGKIVAAAKYHQIIAELLEDDNDYYEAVEHYEKAIDFYKMEASYSSANKCLEKVAEYYALWENYDKAILIFQEIACFDLASSLMKYCAKQYLFRAAVCLLCANLDVTSKLETYINMYPAFEDSREYQLIVCLMECIEDNDFEGFTNAIRKFDSVTHLSQWHITMLLRAKNQIQDIPDLK
ncbi:unnamed protein product [Phaedon cochleariae]|uniref:Soluble NSF attachment protein n=1 Tax=Phaedon cochleariae TaxID=80249 RepID=A0A9P0DYU1_PHACE|nr:unnamed protein product [Phaedon cochleariae]